MRTRQTQKMPLLIASALLAVASSMGCSRPNTVYADPSGVRIAADPAITIDDGAVLPRGFYNQSVNSASVDIARDASSKSYLHLRVLGGTNSVGGFNGTGVGNRSLVGAALYDGVSLSGFGGFEVDAKILLGSVKPDLALIVDLNCNGSAPVVLRAEAGHFASVMVLADGFQRYSARVDESVWSASQNAISDPVNPAIELVPVEGSGVASSLDALIAAYPNACFKNAATSDPALPRSFSTAAILFSLGSETETGTASLLIDRVKIGSDVYNVWGTP